MKKIIGVIVSLFIVFIILVYWSLNTKPDTVETSKLVNFENFDAIDFKEHDSVLITATTQYKSNELKNLMQGEHYRKAWLTPVKVPVVYLDSLFGGMKVVKEGGGKQTQSLKLLATNGIFYTLRSINKEPEALIPEFAKTLGLENIVIDGISAQHPYSAIVVANLAESAGILHTFPRLVFVPKQSSLGNYNKMYGNRLFLLEYETESTTNWTTHENVIQIADTKVLQEMKMIHRERLSIDEHALVRARLFDLIIGDWDRHAKQWGWVIQQIDDKYKAIPLPTDRDNAFFNLGGVIPSIISNRNINPDVRPFSKEIDYLPGLVMDFDVYFLHDVPESVFVEEAEHLQYLLNDVTIEKALHLWPDSIYDLDGNEIADKIKSRRNNLVAYAKEFKSVLNTKTVLNEPLKGSEDLDLPNNLLQCFECEDYNN